MTRQVFVITVTGEMDPSLRDEFEDVEHHRRPQRDPAAPRQRRSVGAARRSSHRIDALGLELLDVHRVDGPP